jgi:hypothetical protein
MINVIKNIAKYIFKKWIFNKFAIVTKDKNYKHSLVTIGSLKTSSRYKSVYLGKEAKVSNSLKISFNILNKLENYILNTDL